MINLLPTENLRQLRAAQQNTLLLRYIIFSAITLGAIVMVHLTTFTILKLTENQGKASTEENMRQVAKHSDTQRRAQEYAANLQTAKALFARHVQFTTALLNLAAAVPENVILENIDLSQDDPKKAVVLSARAKSYDDGIALRDSLSHSKLAKDVTIGSLINTAADNKGGGDGPANEYPFTVSLNLTFTPELLKEKK